MSSIIKSLAIALSLMLGATASMADAVKLDTKVTTNDIQIYTTDNKDGKITAKTIEKAFTDAGFSISGNNDMNVAFKSKFKKTHHKLYHLFTTYKKS